MASVPVDAFARLAPREQASVLRLLLDLDRAEEAVSLARHVRSGPALLDLQAEALLRLHRQEDALAVVVRREQAGVSSVSLGLRARALARLGRLDEARRAVEAAGDPESYLARALVGEALLEGGDAQSARDVLEKAVAAYPERRRGLLALVEACAAQGDHVTGSAFAARLLDTQDENEGTLSARYLVRLRAFYAQSGESNRLADVDAQLRQLRARAAADLAALVAAAPAPFDVPAMSAPSVAAGDAPPVSDEEMRRAAGLVRRHLGFASLREGQAEVIARVLRGEDVLAIMPTGGGKSICYQLPAVITPGVTLVVSPLIALMKDQLEGLPPAMRAAAAAITSQLPPREARRLVEEVRLGRYRLLYVAPERLRQPPLLRALREAGVDRLVVDEAHCVSVWGHDFRPDYLHIGEARRALGSPPLLAVTATAPPRVAHDIAQRLGRLHLVRASLARPNLRLEAILASDQDEKLQHLLALCQETRGPGIVYAASRAKCEQLATALASKGVRAEAYHAGLPDRALRQEAFMRGDVDVLVATVAFGMGVDKGDIRFVFHHDPSTSLESYMQEAGRAGRDGAPARCVLIATRADGGALKQRARADLPHPDLLDRAWRLVAQGAADDGYATIDHEALPSLEADDVQARVALSILAEAGAMARLPDVPRAVRIHRAGDETALAPFEGRDAGVFELAPALGVAPEDVEPRLLDLQGRIAFDTAGRLMLFRVAGDLSRVETVLDRYAALAQQRGKEVMDYVKTPRCRHAYLLGYFGETAPDRCAACDSCLGIGHEPASADAEDDEAAARAILDVLSGLRGIGETNLTYLLRGDARAAEWVAGHPRFGALAFRSPARIKQLLRGLEARGLVAREQLPHGGLALRITPQGVEATAGAQRLVAAGSVADRPRARGQEEAEGDLPEEAARLFGALKAWRREVADAEGVPPYVVAHDRTLRDLALRKPRTREALRETHGMGPKKVEKYGDAILALVTAGSGKTPPTA